MLDIPEEHKGKKLYSFSKLTSFYDCLHKFDRVYNQKDRGENNFWGEVGSIVHDIIEKHLKGELALEDMSLEFQRPWYNMQYRMFPQMEASYYSKIYQFFQDFPSPNQRVVSVEGQFYIHIDSERSLMGFEDMVTMDDDGNITVTDWKISKPFTKKDEKSKKRQLYIYARAAKEKWGRYPTNMVFFFVKEGAFYNYEFDKDELIETLNWVKETADLIDERIDSGGPWPDKIMEAMDSGIDVNNKKAFDRFFCENLCPHRNTCESFTKLRNGELI
jgi:hypothetical protein